MPPEISTDIQIPATVGFFLSLLVSVITRPAWPNWVKGLIVIGSSVVAGIVTAAMHGDLGGVGWYQAIGIVLATTFAAYKLVWYPTGIGPKIESKTDLWGLLTFFLPKKS